MDFSPFRVSTVVKNMPQPLLEVCIDSLQSAIAAQEGGAARVELCSDLSSDGTTPSYGLIAEARKHLTIGLHVIIRPRGGDFCYSELEFEVMKRDIEQAKVLGVDGVVLGILTTEHQVDVPRMKILVDLARPMKVTFHRAFDVVHNPIQALEEIIQLGIERILTSGRQRSAIQGLPLLKQLVEVVKDRIIIMPGSGVTHENVNFILKETKAREIHVGKGVADCVTEQSKNMFSRERWVVNPSKVQSLLEKGHEGR